MSNFKEGDLVKAKRWFGSIRHIHSGPVPDEWFDEPHTIIRPFGKPDRKMWELSDGEGGSFGDTWTVPEEYMKLVHISQPSSNKSRRCTCGAWSVKDSRHSNWCDIHGS